MTVFWDIRVFDLVLTDPLMSGRSQRSCLGNSADGNFRF